MPYDARISQRSKTVARTCADCGVSFEQFTDEPYLIHVLCDDCVEQRDRLQVTRDEYFTRASREWFRKASGQ